MLFSKKSLAGVLSKDDIKEELDRALTLYNDTTKIMLDNGLSVERNLTYKGKVGKLLMSTLAGFEGRTTPPCQTLTLALRDYSDKILKLQKLVDSEFGKKVTQEGLDARQANILEYASSFGFANRYINLALNMLLAEEIEDDYYRSAYARDRVEWLDLNAMNFKRVLRVLSIDINKVISAMTKIPALSIEITNEEVEAADMGDVNPLKQGFIPVSLNPAFYINMAIANFRDNRHREAISQKLWFEQQIERLKGKQAGKEDARIEKQLEYYSEQWEKINHDISRYEEGLQ